MKNTPKIIAIVGPTASGKTDIAIKVAQQINGEIISADSRLVYKDFNIGTAKPNQDELAAAKHYMIDVADPTDNYTVGIYQTEADKVIQDILSRNKVPIIAGGTGFYVRALLEGLDLPNVRPDEEYRKELDEFVLKNGKEALHNKLKDVDPVTALKLHPNDTFRITRALEVIKNLGKTMAEAKAMKEPKYSVVYAGLNTEDREFLYVRVNSRVLKMIEMGLVDEVKFLIAKYGKTLSLLKTLGYKEICEYLDDNCSLDEAIAAIQKNTRNYAKRQLTWFRANKNIKWHYIDVMSGEEIVREIIKTYHERI